MSDNAELVEAVQTWIALDDKLKALQKDARTTRLAKKQATDHLSGIMDNLDIGTVNLGANDKIVRRERKSRGALTKKYLTECLGQLFSHDAAQKERVTNHILDNRPVTVKEDVQRKKPGNNKAEQ